MFHTFYNWIKNQKTQETTSIIEIIQKIFVKKKETSFREKEFFSAELTVSRKCFFYNFLQL